MTTSDRTSHPGESLILRSSPERRQVTPCNIPAGTQPVERLAAVPYHAGERLPHSASDQTWADGSAARQPPGGQIVKLKASASLLVTAFGLALLALPAPAQPEKKPPTTY